MVGARVRRQQVASARRRGLSSRRACAVLSVARSTLGYESRLRQRDAPALAVMRERAGQYPRSSTHHNDGRGIRHLRLAVSVK